MMAMIPAVKASQRPRGNIQPPIIRLAWTYRLTAQRMCIPAYGSTSRIPHASGHATPAPREHARRKRTVRPGHGSDLITFRHEDRLMGVLSPITAHWENEPGLPGEVTLRIEPSPTTGAMTVVEIKLTATDGVSSSSLRGVPLSRLRDAVIEWVAMPVRIQKGEVTLSPGRRVSSKAVQAAVTAKPQRRPPATDDELRKVASAYRHAVKDHKPTTAAVQAAMHCSSSRARRLVSQARLAGFLGPALGRMAGEQ